MQIEFVGKVVLVTGAAQGIGKTIALRFKEAGAKVYLTDLDADGLRQAGNELACPFYASDLADRRQAHELVSKIIERDGRLDILALAAGGVCGLAGLDLEDVTEENWTKIVRANLDTVLWLSQAAAVPMKSNGWGRIVTIASNAGVRPSLTGMHAYTSAKHAVVGLTKQLSVGLGRYGITANSVAPGLLMTSPDPKKQWDGYGEEGQRRYLDTLHTKRMGDGDDVAAAALFFASEQADWITGQVLSVDGGRS